MSELSLRFSRLTNRSMLAELGFVEQNDVFWLERLDVYVSTLLADSSPIDRFYRELTLLMRENNAEWER